MQLRNGINVKGKKTQDFLEQMQQKDEGIYIKDGIVFRKDLTTGKTVEALGTLAEYKPEKCKECPFLIKDPSGRDALSVDDGDLFYKGGCIVRSCVEDILFERRAYAVAHRQSGLRAKEFQKHMWSNKRQ